MTDARTLLYFYVAELEKMGYFRRFCAPFKKIVSRKSEPLFVQYVHKVANNEKKIKKAKKRA